MGFESYRQGAFTRRLADLPDQPNMQAAELKTYFDSSPEELRLTIPVFLLLGWLIPCMMYDNAAKCSIVDQLRDAQ